MSNLTNWIWTPDWNSDDDSRARIVYFRKKINIDKVTDSRCIRISADSRYKLFVNGEFVQEGPQKALDLKEWFVDTADIGPFLMQGVNVVAVEVLRFPEPNLSFGVPVSNDSLLRSPIANLFIEEMGDDEANDARDLIDGKTGWKCFVNREISIVDEASMPAPIHAQEIVKSSGFFLGWKSAEYDDSQWYVAKAKEDMEMPKSDAPGNLIDRSIPYMHTEKEKFSGVKKIRKSDAEDCEAQKVKWEEMLAGEGKVSTTIMIPAGTTEIVEISADVEECGYLIYKFAVGTGAKVTTLCAECYAFPPLDEEIGPVFNPIKGNRIESENGTLYGHTSEYIVAGCGNAEKPEEYEPFWFRTFRFIQLKIETAEEPLQILEFSYRRTGYPLEVKTKAQTSDSSFAPIWDISLRTLKRCMHDTYVDCPFYEQLQYAMDGREEILYTYSVSADDRLARQAIEAFRRSQRSDGLVNADAPTQKSNVIPGFSIYYILMVHDHMMYFGDKKLVRENWNAIDQILEFYNNHLAENGMVAKIGGSLLDSTYWSFVDWTPQWNDTLGVPSATLKGTGALTVESLLYAYGLQMAAELSDYVGRSSIGQEYRQRADSLLQSIRENAMGVYTNSDGKKVQLVQDGPGVDDYSVHTQVFAILTGLVTKEEGKEMLQSTVGVTDIPQSSVSYMFYLFRALEIAEWYEKTDDLWNLWRKMIDDNLSTCVENNTDGRSDCHAWASLILYELPSTILGVRPAAPGYSEIAINPIPGKLKYAQGDVITPKGIVHVEWNKGNDGIIDINHSISLA